jgi:CPA1 family monovalent cation:H+ antiporter
MENNFGMSTTTTEYIDKFWELLDEILNAVLFVLIGLELLVIEINKELIFAVIAISFLALMIRYFSVWVPSLAIRFKEKMTYKTLIILTWGGISIALALFIPK